jgi:hypothetical protein
MFGAHPMLRTGGAVSYSVPYALRFRAANSAYLSRTSGASPTSKRTFTYSAWIKAAPSLSSSTQIALVSSSANNGMIGWNIVSFGGRLFIRNDAANDIQFSGLFRDPSAWGHLVVAIDTTQATSSDRVKVYWNGVAMTYLSGTYPSLNYDSYLNAASTAYRIMSDTVNGTYVDGYLAEMNFIDGQALTPSSFGQTDSATGVWVPKAYAGTYGTNGFYLKFADATTTTTIGNDSSGNANNFTTSGISVTSGVTFDQMLDTPTLNYAVMNPLDLSGTAATFQWANMQVTRSGASFAQAYCSIQMSSGKWYCEMTAGADVANLSLGLITGTANAAANRYLGQDSFTYGYDPDGRKVNSGTYTAYGNTWTAGDIIGIILDADNGKLYFSKNGTVQNSGDPVAGTNAAFTGLTGPYRFSASLENGGIGDFNFGQRAFSYTPPSGFKALNTTNLPTPSIKKGSLYMDATLRTGTGATASVSSLGFQPNLVWIKSRSAATDHGLYDAVRGVQKQLESNTTTAETTETTGLTAFNSNGYTVGALAQLNTSAATYVDWAWRETLTAGFDIMTYTGNGVSGRTVAHSLGVTPAMIIVKNRDSATAIWSVAHKSLTAGYNVGLNLTNAQFQPGNSAYGGISAFDSSTFTVVTGVTDQRNVNTNGDNYVAYLWSEIEGFSKFGSYVGNGSTDGPFVWCGFRPRYVLIKSTGIENWSVQDSARNPYNVVDARLKPNSLDAEGVGSAQNVDFLSNGFKLRTTDPEKNSSSVTYIFAAFAENPFKYARAR